MSDQYKDVYRLYLAQRYNKCTLCKKELKLFKTADFIPENKSDYQLKPFCRNCAEITYVKNSK